MRCSHQQVRLQIDRRVCGRAQNSLPVWHTHSTVTGSATTLGLNGHKRNSSGNFDGKDSGLNGKEGDDAALADHYARLAEQGLVPTVKREPGLEDEEADLDMEELEDVRLASGTIADAVQRVTGMFRMDLHA